jgi:hypothetical protein
MFGFLKWVVVASVVGYLVAVSAAQAQEVQSSLKLVPRVVHGPMVAAIAVGQDYNGLYHTSVLTEGAGWKVGVNWVNVDYMPVISLEIPFLIGADSATDAFAAKAGLAVGFFGNLAVGATYDLISTNAGVGTGLFTGNNSSQNLTFLFGLTAAFGNPNGSMLAVSR